MTQRRHPSLSRFCSVRSFREELKKAELWWKISKTQAKTVSLWEIMDALDFQ